MDDYILYWDNGGVIDDRRPSFQTEQDYIQAQLDQGVVKIYRRGDGVVVYERAPK